MAAGDTRWTSAATCLLYLVFVGGLVLADHLRLGLYAEWTWATAFVLISASVWIWRFRAGVWKTICVIEGDGSPAKLS
jgi:Na+-driven multidrug efflux pump